MKMRYPGNTVTIDDTRSTGGGRGSPDKCFYCKGETHEQHEEHCVTLDRPVKLRVSFDIITIVPRSHDKHDIEFRYNESSYCADNMLDTLEQYGKANGCLCSVMSVEMVGEATLEEAVAVGFKPDSEEYGEDEDQ